MQTFINNLVKNLLSVVLMLFLNSQAMADIAVIVSANSDITYLSSGEVKAIYLGKNKSLKPFDQREGSAIRKQFSDKVLGKNESQFKAYWSKKIFSGKGSPPKVLDSDTDVRNQVAASIEAIGYIDDSAVDSTVKVVYKVR